MHYFISQSAKQTQNLGYQLGKQLLPTSIICLFGDLGVGKTTFTQGLVKGVTGQDYVVDSPTFTYLNIYSHPLTSSNFYHFDLYRLQNSEEFLKMGFEEYLFSDGICCIEWSEKIEEILIPLNYHKIILQHLTNEKGEQKDETNERRQILVDGDFILT